MSVLDWTDVDRIYSNCGSLALTFHDVEFPALRQFAHTLYEFEYSLEDLRTEDYWKVFLQKLRRLRFEVCAFPLDKGQRHQIIQEVLTSLNAHIRHCSRLFPRFADNARMVLEDTEALDKCDSNPLLDAIKSIVVVNGNVETALVLKASRLITATSDLLKTTPELFDIKVVMPSELRRGQNYDRLIVVGPAKWFSADLFSSPRAGEIRVVKFDWIADHWNLANDFIAPLANRKCRTYSLGTDDALKTWDDPVVLLPLTDLTEVANRIKREGLSEDLNYDGTEARAYLLADEQVVFLDADGDSSILVIDLDDPEEQVKRISLEDLDVGMYILLRTAGGGDYIIPIADRLLGRQAIPFRTCQRTWKSLLTETLKKLGVENAVSALSNLGATHANEVNVQNWMSSRSIRTRYLDDFTAIMKLIGLENKSTEYWEIMSRIASAHHRAGFEVRDRLLELVGSSDLRLLVQQGKMEFTLPSMEGSSLTAFRVEAIGTEMIPLPSARIGYPFKMENE